MEGKPAYKEENYEFKRLSIIVLVWQGNLPREF